VELSIVFGSPYAEVSGYRYMSPKHTLQRPKSPEEEAPAAADDVSDAVAKMQI